MKELILFFKEKKVSYPDFSKYLEEAYKPLAGKEPEAPIIPVSVFDNNYLSSLEAVVKYLHENKELRLTDIAKLVKRDQRAVGVTYRFARKKMKVILRAPVSKYSLPVSAIAGRKLSVLESIVYHLRKTYSLSYHEIALIMRRDDRTVWTVYNRALRKLKQ